MNLNDFPKLTDAEENTLNKLVTSKKALMKIVNEISDKIRVIKNKQYRFKAHKKHYLSVKKDEDKKISRKERDNKIAELFVSGLSRKQISIKIGMNYNSVCLRIRAMKRWGEL